MSAYFITGTGTDIGKTFVAAGLIRYLRQHGQTVRALKPLATGFDMKAAEASDPGVLLAALGLPVTEEEIARIAPWRFAAPLAPDMAAKREGGAVDFDAIVEFSRAGMQAHEGLLLIEGLGGVMSPLDGRRTVADWMMALGAPVILVTGSYLGALSHTLTAMDALLAREIAIAAIVVNESAQGTVPLAETAEAVRSFATTIEVIALPRLARGDAVHPGLARLAALLTAR